jgi:hypothetical protein
MPGADDLDAVRDEFADTLDAIEGKFDLGRRWRDLSARVRARAAEQPIPVAAIGVAGVAVVALGAVIVYRIVRH